ncbi:MAG: serine/threonine protein kinase, partial [Planctomycetota bacterium]
MGMSSIPEMSRRPSDARTTARTAPPRDAPQSTPPEHIGRYRILRRIGSGGMGAVYEAEQENPRRVVALKVIRASVLSADTIRRFSQEAHVLGRLQHPGIAQIYEAGVAQLGEESQPFFAMEYVRGRSLLQYAAEQELGIRERLELLVQIGDAVQHAHERGVIHRDLK